MDVRLTGYANDYVGKGMNGGTIVVRQSLPCTHPYNNTHLCITPHLYITIYPILV